MPFQMIVLVKQVPDTSNIGENAMKEDGTVNREVLPTIINPEDLCALEEALKIKEKFGGNITAISMGPPKAEEALKHCLSMGADRAILLSDKKFAAADTLATSYVLSLAIKKIGNFDLVFCGRQAIDGDTAQVGPQVAEKLSINQFTFVLEVLKVSRDYLEVKREIPEGYEIVRSPLPLLLTISKDANIPRPPSVKRTMALKGLKASSPPQAKDKDSSPLLELWDHRYIGAEENRCGLKGSATRVKKVESVVLTARESKQYDCSKHAIKDMLSTLLQEHILG